MKDFIDRVSSGKKIIKYENGTTETVTIENAEDATVEGTPINRENMMAVQGFKNSQTNIIENGNVTIITETNQDDNSVYTTTVTENEDGSITVVEVFEGEKTITKTTEINADGNVISEVVK